MSRRREKSVDQARPPRIGDVGRAETAIASTPGHPDPQPAPADCILDPVRREASRLPREHHGPARPRSNPYGLARLRSVLKLSEAVMTDEVCDQAAFIIENVVEKPAKFTLKTWRR